jgi:hypothetical protein
VGNEQVPLSIKGKAILFDMDWNASRFHLLRRVNLEPMRPHKRDEPDFFTDFSSNWITSGLPTTRASALTL